MSAPALMSWPKRLRSLLPGLLLAATRLALADPAMAESRACEATSQKEARSTADQLYERGDYQRAGQCYQLAGEPTRANAAFVKAAGAHGAEAANAFKAQRDSARTLLVGVQQAFRSGH